MKSSVVVTLDVNTDCLRCHKPNGLLLNAKAYSVFSNFKIDVDRIIYFMDFKYKM